jgi:hypothetical protein
VSTSERRVPDDFAQRVRDASQALAHEEPDPDAAPPVRLLSAAEMAERDAAISASIEASAAAARDDLDGDVHAAIEADPKLRQQSEEVTGQPPRRWVGMDAEREELQRLPDDFWSARPELLHIRQAAHARLCAADAVLGGVLAYIAARVPYGLGLPPIVGAEAGLALLVSVVGPPGTGKSSGVSVAGELLTYDPRLVIVPSGSGEGIAETFYDTVMETDERGKTRAVRKLTKHNTLVVVDEGQKATRQASQRSSTLFATWRTAFIGGLLGEQNADPERRRPVPGGWYSLGLVAAFQPEALATLFDDVAAGTPQRFVYLAGQDPRLPDEPSAWPGKLRWAPPELWGRAVPDAVRHQHVVVAESVVGPIRRDHLARQRGTTSVDHWSAHRNLIRLKVAALLGILDGRVDVAEDDWALAGMVIVASEHVRAAAHTAISRESERVESEASARYSRRQVQASRAVETNHIVDTARALTKLVRTSPGALAPSDARRKTRHSRRQWVEDALDHALSVGWIVERTEPGHGTARTRLYPGPHRP